MTRSELREATFALLFEKAFHEGSAELFYTELLGKVFTEEDIYYIRAVLTAFSAHKEDIDGLIAQNSKNWRLERIPCAELTIMRLALCEMLYLDGTPRKVALNEAVELTKRYCAEDSYGFVNGVLGAVYKTL